jgi:hypothetical protein
MIPPPKPEDAKGKPADGEIKELVSGMRRIVWSDLQPGIAELKGLELDSNNGTGAHYQG